tara:strand:- start:445 stop:1077 length:633 start_codon:yes stop_codon:yes gene_type:complete
MFSSNKPTEDVTEQVTEKTSRRSPLKAIAIVAGSVFAIAHVGLLGYVLKPNSRIQEPPVINIPRGDYSSYKIKANKDGYEIEYRANDPRVMESSKSLTLDKQKKGWFGGTDEKRTEFRRDQFTMDGTRNIGGELMQEGKLSARDAECIVADAGARSQGAMAGSALATGLAAPAVSAVPYVGWLVGGWALLLGQNIGSEVGSQVGSVFNDC